MEIRKIVEQWLRANNYDGLAGDECGCKVDDLMPCDIPNMFTCVPGYTDGNVPWNVSTIKPEIK